MGVDFQQCTSEDVTSILNAASLRDEVGIGGIYCTHETEPELCAQRMLLQL